MHSSYVKFTVDTEYDHYRQKSERKGMKSDPTSMHQKKNPIGMLWAVFVGPDLLRPQEASLENFRKHASSNSHSSPMLIWVKIV